MSDYRYDVIVRDVIDGDTVVVDLDCGFSIWQHGMRIRLHGINAPEMNTPEGKAAKVWLQLHIRALGPSNFELQTLKDKPDKYGGRYLGILKGRSATQSVNETLVQFGHAVKWDGKGKKP